MWPKKTVFNIRLRGRCCKGALSAPFYRGTSGGDKNFRSLLGAVHLRGAVFMSEAEFAAIEEAQSRHEADTRPAWRSPSVTRIDLARTLIKPGSGGDGGHASVSG